MRKARSQTSPFPINTPGKPPTGYDFEDEELQPAIDALGPLCQDERTHSLQWHYDFGKAVLQYYMAVQREREKFNRSMYGEHFFERLAEAIPTTSVPQLNDCMKLATVYSPKAFQELCQHDIITVSHARQLACIGDPKTRAELQANVIEKRWTVRDLNAAVKALAGPTRKPGAGRPIKQPRNIQAAVTHLTEQAAHFIKLNDKIWFGRDFDIVASVADLPADELDDDLFQQLSDAAELCSQMADAASRDAERFVDAIADVEQRMEAQAEIEYEAEEEEACAGVGG